jgi:hypothetical protein
MSDQRGVPLDVEATLHELEQLVGGAKAVPLSASIMLNRAEIDGLVHDLRATLPDELTQARWVIRERDEILERAQADADRLLSRRRTPSRTGSSPSRRSCGPPSSRPNGSSRNRASAAGDAPRGRGLRRRQARQLRGGAVQDPVRGRTGPGQAAGRHWTPTSSPTRCSTSTPDEEPRAGPTPSSRDDAGDDPGAPDRPPVPPMAHPVPPRATRPVVVGRFF